jgi:hypothetical protein
MTSEGGMRFQQNVLSVVWDFDKTLISHYMQDPLFAAYGIDGKTFWSEVNALPELYRQRGVPVNAETIYLNHLLAYVRTGRFPGLNNARLRELGQKLTFFPGIPQLFEETRELVAAEPYSTFDLKVEHYIVSTGMAEVIRGSLVAPHVDGIWGCELLESTFVPGAVPGPQGLIETPQPGVVTEIAATIDNTTKTRAIFEINKGVNKHPEISVNQKMPEDERRVPVAQMIYIADGPSDVPAFSVVKKGGGKTLAVYRSQDAASFNQARHLQDDQRVDHFAEADYRTGSNASMWILSTLRDQADRIVERNRRALAEGQHSVPKHLS